MVITIAIITILFAACAVYAYKAKADFPTFTDEQLLNQHRRFLSELESSRSYIGATYFHAVEKGSPAQAELMLRGYDIDKLLRERVSAEQEDRPLNWNACRLGTSLQPPGKSAS
ncbi:MAG: hypothetical protein GKS00_03110 [Alphaproteobacteria bacterium]|nr:hypothetical protein [Alphaproteobacteria bacterium]